MIPGPRLKNELPLFSLQVMANSIRDNSVSERKQKKLYVFVKNNFDNLRTFLDDVYNLPICN